MRFIADVLALAAVVLGAATVTALGCTALSGLNGYEVVGGAGGAGGGGGAQAGGGAGGGCQDPASCPGQDEDCHYRSCVQGVCGFANADAGSPCAGDDLHRCDGAGQCKLSNGQPCGTPDDCASGSCADGLCCDGPCDGACEACVGAATGSDDGVCAPIAALTDPDGECIAAPALGCDGTAAGDCAQCGAVAPPPGPDAPCPAVCSGGCLDGVCTIDASVAHQFDAGTIDCPADYACVVDCHADHACTGATINCPAQYACTVICTATQHKCETAIVNCPAKGSCTIDCQGGDTCTSTEVHCGANDCAATCAGGAAVPALSGCGGCACTPCSWPRAAADAVRRAPVAESASGAGSQTPGRDATRRAAASRHAPLACDGRSCGTLGSWHASLLRANHGSS